ncbi:sulfotransferase family protein [Vibrio genomosp. F10 str. 9ZC157]|uniref:Sulfotransferase domain-containing protein n=1 Tax=Vibrio genomosp. F10 str. ZF-129 TaxID=1187848 RepID=A0A1E5BD99_9VIBR|nr:sulfotransferase family protein [Vibrio genomosp. F10]OEE33118.1 hypothetical protein A1QO_10580 [Vibrio genomosp. F10 str. ZF-129]OEE95619.1 hypothetical protein A1QM_04580 [Vibrio genomosp. F10 str. 9ZC157]
MFKRISKSFIGNLKSNKSNDFSQKNVNLEEKVFCIGFNKTGTTSIEKTLNSFGYRMGDQATGEMLIFDWGDNNFDRIVRFSETAEAFQDIPFSLPNTYKALDGAFPNAKFILTVRQSSDVWHRSLCNFHTKVFSSDQSRLPNEEDFRNALYRYKGYIYDASKVMYNFPNVPLYDKKKYTKMYDNHNADVKKYFSDKPEKLLVLNLAEQGSYHKLCKFLGKEAMQDEFPWENKT